MPFCPNCGAQTLPENKFCDHCGAPFKNVQKTSVPVEDNSPPSFVPQPPLDNIPHSPPSIDIPPIPPTPPPPPPPPLSTGPIYPNSPEGPVIIPDYSQIVFPQKKIANRVIPLIIIAIIGALVIIAVVVFVKPPFLQSGDPIYKETVNDKPLLPKVTTQMPMQATMYMTPAPAPSQRIVYLSGVPYQQVYSINQQFKTGQSEVFSFDLTQPPIVVQLELTPKIASRKKLVDIGTANERYITAEYPSPDSWFEIKVFDADTGVVLTSLGFGKNYNVDTKQEHTIRTNGKYRFVMQGNEISANVQILVKS